MSRLSLIAGAVVVEAADKDGYSGLDPFACACGETKVKRSAEEKVGRDVTGSRISIEI